MPLVAVLVKFLIKQFATRSFHEALTLMFVIWKSGSGRYLFIPFIVQESAPNPLPLVQRYKHDFWLCSTACGDISLVMNLDISF